MNKIDKTLVTLAKRRARARMRDRQTEIQRKYINKINN